MDLAATHQANQIVADSLQPERLLDRGAVILRHLYHVLEAEEIRCMQHVDVERVALNPLAAVEEAPQQPGGRIHCDAHRPLQRVDRAHLVSDGADAADAGRDVGNLREVPAAQEGLEHPRRLEDRQLDILNPVTLQLDLQASFALHAGQEVDVDVRNCLVAWVWVHDRSLPSLTWRNCQDHALKLRNVRVIVWSFMPRTRKWFLRDAALVLSMGPKQP